MQTFIDDNDILIYSTHNKGKELVVDSLWELWRLKSRKNDT